MTTIVDLQLQSSTCNGFAIALNPNLLILYVQLSKQLVRHMMCRSLQLPYTKYLHTNLARCTYSHECMTRIFSEINVINCCEAHYWVNYSGIPYRPLATNAVPAVAAAVCTCFAKRLALLSLLCVCVCPCSVPKAPGLSELRGQRPKLQCAAQHGLGAKACCLSPTADNMLLHASAKVDADTKEIQYLADGCQLQRCKLFFPASTSSTS